MTPTSNEILVEDLEHLQKWFDLLQNIVPANDIWQNNLLWELTKIVKDILEKETRK